MTFLAICGFLGLGDGLAQRAENHIYNITPTIDRESSTGLYIPKDLEDCFKELKIVLPPALIEEIRSGTEDDMARYHRDLGVWLRNNWGLWSGSRLKDYFNNQGIKHPDDMSGIILISFWRHLNNKPIQLREQISYYQRYWKDLKKDKEEQ
jgi:hypothetical protein